MGADRISSRCFSPEEESSLENDFQETSSETDVTFWDDFTTKAKKIKGNWFQYEVFDDLGRGNSSYSLDSETLRRRRRRAFEDISENYDALRRRSVGMEEAKTKILSYTPGAWIEEVGGLKMSDYDIPKTTTLILIGPRGCGKSTLVNEISMIFEGDKFAPGRAQVSYNSSAGDGTYFLQEYMIPRGSTSFCLYDTRSLSENSSDNFKMLKSWMTKGVRHGELVISDSDNSSTRISLKCKARQTGYYSGKMRMVNFVIFVVNGLSVLKSMDGEDDMQYNHMLAKTFSCPYLSFKDDKPVVVITHSDLLSYSDCTRVRIHLGELLGIPPVKQIFNFPEKYGSETEVTIVDMIRYSLAHADRNLPFKNWAMDKDYRNSFEWADDYEEEQCHLFEPDPEVQQLRDNLQQSRNECRRLQQSRDECRRYHFLFHATGGDGILMCCFLFVAVLFCIDIFVKLKAKLAK